MFNFKEWYINNKHRYKQYRLNRKDEIKIANTERYKNNREDRLIKQKKYYIENKKPRIDYAKNYRATNREKYLLYNYTSQDKKKKLICDLTEIWIKEHIINKSCIYCGSNDQIGCDRIDNSKGHTKNNCVPCCYVCNTVRNKNFTVEEMKLLGKTIKLIRKQRKCQK